VAGGTTYFGHIAKVAYFSGALTQSDVVTIMNSQ
jgi:hypothetical protein